MSDIIRWIVDAKRDYGIAKIRLSPKAAWALCRDLALLQRTNTRSDDLFSGGRANIHDVEVTWPLYKSQFDAYVDAVEAKPNQPVS